MRLPKARITLDLEQELLQWIMGYAKQNGLSRNEAIGEAVALLKNKVESGWSTERA